VPLPKRWLKGFAEVQFVSSQMFAQHELSAVQAGLFLKSLPRTKSRSVAWATPAGGTLRLASRPGESSVCLAGPERLRLLEKLIPYLKSLRVYGVGSERVDEPRASAWELDLDGARVFFVLSPELFRGFSGEGGVLSDLDRAEDDMIDSVAEHLHGEAVIDPSSVAAELGADRSSVQTALGALSAAGRVGFDLSAGAYFHRELPFDREALEQLHPRLLSARKLVEEGAVILDDEGGGASVRSGDAEYRVRFEDGIARCTCAWFAKHGRERGPCKHVLAVQHVRREARV
jgi:hypothetical protein